MFLFRRSVSFFAMFGLLSISTLLVVDSPVSRPHPGPSGRGSDISSPDVKAAAVAALNKLPPLFEANKGQTDPAVKFISRGAGHTTFLTPQEAVFKLTRPGKASDKTLIRKGSRAESRRRPDIRAAETAVVRMRPLGANPSAKVEGLSAAKARSNYFTGAAPEAWQKGVPNYKKVAYRDIYPGIDLVFHSAKGALEYDFIVRPGSSPDSIRLSFEGQQRLRLHRGDLVIETGAGEIVQRKPEVYQNISGRRRPVKGSYVLHGDFSVSFRVGRHDPSRPLIIDPVVAFSTYLGRAGHDGIFGLAVDAAGNIYVAGGTHSADFPTSAVHYQRDAGGRDAFISKFNPSGTSLIYSTYYGGDGSDTAYDVDVDRTGSAYIFGDTYSLNLPVKSAIQGQGPLQGSYGGEGDFFIAKLNAFGSDVIYSTYLGGDDWDSAYRTTVVSDPNFPDRSTVYLTGHTYSGNFPTTCCTSNSGDSDAVVAWINHWGEMNLSAYLGGSGYDAAYDIAVDHGGSAVVTGETESSDFPTAGAALQTSRRGSWDAFVSKVAINGTIPYSTYLGGNDYEGGFGIAVDSSDNLYISGDVYSTDFPTTPNVPQRTKRGNWDAFLTKLHPSGSTVVYSGYLGGSGDELTYSMGLGPSGNAIVIGTTNSNDFPTSDPSQASRGGGLDAFVSSYNSPGSSLAFSTYLGGADDEYPWGVKADSAGAIYVGGVTFSRTYPTTPGAYQPGPGGGSGGFDPDGFVTKIQPFPPDVLSTPSISIIGPQAVLEASGAPATFTLRLSRLSDQPVVVRYTTVDGTAKFVNTPPQGPDYLRYSGQVTIPAGTQSVTFGVKIFDDQVDEGAGEYFEVQLLAPVNATLGAGNRARATITDDDP